MNKIAKNAIWIIGCKIVKMILTLVVTMITARYLGPANYGLINYAAGLVAFVTPIMKLGIESIMVHEFVQHADEEGKIIGTSIVMNIISAVLCAIGVITFAIVANVGETETIIVCAIYSLVLIMQAIEMIQYWFQAKLLSKYTAISMVVAYFIVSIIQLVILMKKMSVYWLALSYSIEFLIIAVFLIVKYNKICSQKIKFSIVVGKRLLSKSRYYIVSNMMVTIFAQTDKIMLKLMNGNEAVGYYSAGATCAGMISFVFAAIIDSARSTIFKSKEESQEQFENNMILLYSIIIYCSLIVSLIICLCSPIIINIIYGRKYEPSINALRISVWYTTFSYLGTVRNIWILSANKQKYLWRINLAGAMLNVVINFILIPKYGIEGAAIASLVTQIFTNVCMGYIIRPIKKNNKLMEKACNPLIIFEFMKKMISSLKSNKK